MKKKKEKRPKTGESLDGFHLSNKYSDDSLESFEEYFEEAKIRPKKEQDVKMSFSKRNSEEYAE
jgi:hypothetical protein